MILIKLLQIIQMLLQKFFLTSSSRIRTGVKSSGWGKPSLDWLYYQKKKKKTHDTCLQGGGWLRLDAVAHVRAFRMLIITKVSVRREGCNC